VVALLALALAGCAAARRPGAAPGPRTHVIRIRGFTFVPDQLTVAVGDSVAWINEDAFRHTTTADGGAWRSPELARGARFAAAPAASGAYPYHCAAHPAMRAVLSVSASK
jgi:plastocyanin